jgi:hypothetical protein
LEEKRKEKKKREKKKEQEGMGFEVTAFPDLIFIVNFYSGPTRALTPLSMVSATLSPSN